MSETWERVAERVSFQLTYARAEEKREFSLLELSGPDLPNAYSGEHGSASASGYWMSEDIDWRRVDDDSLSEDEYLAHYASMAIGEAVHEALEWFRVDGTPWLDPHGRAEAEIYERVRELCSHLAGLRRGHAPAEAVAS